MDIGQDPTSAILRLPSLRPFRNTFIHYGLDSRCPTMTLDFGKLLAGLADFNYPGVGFTKLSAQLQEQTERVATSLIVATPTLAV
jgi:hypothetical protein